MPKKKKIIIIAFSLPFLLFLFLFQNRVKEAFYFASSPLQRALWTVGEEISAVFEAKKEMELLRSQNALLLQQIYKASFYKAENSELRKALNVGLEEEFDLFFSRVVGKKLSGDILIIDKGKKHGILKGMPVITAEKVLVGKIGEVYDYFSEVDLITKEGAVFDIAIKGEIFAIARGYGGLQIKAELIPSETRPEDGAPVLTSGRGGVFTEGLLVGKVEGAGKNDTDFYYEGTIIPAFNSRRIDSLFVVNKPVL